MKKFASVAAYVASYPKPVQSRLNALRKVIKKTAPAAIESLSYAMVGYKLDKRPLVYIGGFTDHVSLFAMPSGRAAFDKELAKYRGGGKSAIQFQHDEPLPLGLIAKIVKFRMKENRARAKR
jgi:uncharacterized protein YdhG (YjbR/CyaY superfamily)